VSSIKQRNDVKLFRITTENRDAVISDILESLNEIMQM